MTALDVLKLFASIVACQLAGAIGSVFTASAVLTWYDALKKPSFTPPGWVFGPAWISLYLLMGVAAFMVWSRGLDDSRVRIGLSVFIAQLLLNALWSPLFFGLRSPLAGLVDIVLLWGLIILTMIYFFKVSTAAGILLVPYILWVSFAAVLNFSILALNS
jgi:tryptophan-rich sensory protein